MRGEVREVRGRGNVRHLCPGTCEMVGGAGYEVPCLSGGLLPIGPLEEADAKIADPNVIEGAVRHAHQGLPDRLDVLHGTCEPADCVEGCRAGHDAGAADITEARLVAVDAAERGGPQDGSGRLRAERDGHHAGRDRRRAAARGAARGVCRPVRVAGLAGMEMGEFGRHRLAEAYAACFLQERDRRRVARRDVAVIDRRSAAHWKPVCLDDVLDAEWNAMERTAGFLRVAQPRGHPRLLGGHMDPGLDPGFARRDVLEASLDEFRWCDALLSDRPAGLASGHLMGCQCGHWNVLLVVPCRAESATAGALCKRPSPVHGINIDQAVSASRIRGVVIGKDQP